jgi:hypothetical protein
LERDYPDLRLLLLLRGEPRSPRQSCRFTVIQYSLIDYVPE